MVADDLWYRDLGCYGATQIKAPRIDRFEREDALTHLEEIGQVSKPEAKSRSPLRLPHQSHERRLLR